MAVGDVAGESVLVEVLSRIEDERDRVLVLAHIGLDISLRNLARAMETTRTELADRIATIMAQLRKDAELVAMLDDVHRAGRNDRYQALLFRLGLQDWFCSYCGEFMLQSELGVKRKTCSDRCRYRLYRAHGIGWKNQHQSDPTNVYQPVSDLIESASIESVQHDKLLALIRPIEVGKQFPTSRPHSNTFWWQPETKCRDRALLLLGFMCPIPLSSSDLAALDIDDTSRHAKGLEVRLYRWADKGKRYTIVLASNDPKLCPVAAISAWRSCMVRTGRTNGPLFIRMDPRGNIPVRRIGSERSLLDTSVRLTDPNIVQIIKNAAHYSKQPYVKYVNLTPSTPLPDFLREW